MWPKTTHRCLAWSLLGGAVASCAIPSYDAGRGPRPPSAGTSGLAGAGQALAGNAGRFAATSGQLGEGGFGGDLGNSWSGESALDTGGATNPDTLDGSAGLASQGVAGTENSATAGSNSLGGLPIDSLAGRSSLATAGNGGASGGTQPANTLGGTTANTAGAGALGGTQNTVQAGRSGMVGGGTSATTATARGGTSTIGGNGSQGGTSTNPTSATATCASTDRKCTGTQMLRCNASRTAVDELVGNCGSAALCQAGLSAGACVTPTCTAGSYTCQDNSRVPCNADLNGYDQTKAVACNGTTPICDAGECVPCANGTKDCLAGAPRQCNNHAWVSGTACTSLEACAVGDCINARIARWKMPNEPSSAYNPARYQLASSNTIVQDLVTGLEWQADVSPTEVNAGSSAEQYCQSLGLGNRHDFRMPTAIELFSLVDFSKTTGLKIDTSVFSNTPLLLIAKESMLAVSFETGAIQREITTGLSYIIRCVRSTVGAISAPRYSVSGGAVTDNYTGLVWNQTNDKSIVYGSTFRSSGCPSPKRVPTVKELMTLIDRSIATPPLIDSTAFTGTKSDNYWSITGSNPGYVVSFTDGSIDQLSMSTDAVGRCLMQ